MTEAQGYVVLACLGVLCSMSVSIGGYLREILRVLRSK